MADWLVLKRKAQGAQVAHEAGVKAWDVHALMKGYTADVAGATQAITDAYDGPGRYGILRADNGRTAQLDFGDVDITDDPSPEWQPPAPS